MNISVVYERKVTFYLKNYSKLKKGTSEIPHVDVCVFMHLYVYANTICYAIKWYCLELEIQYILIEIMLTVHTLTHTNERIYQQLSYSLF